MKMSGRIGYAVAAAAAVSLAAANGSVAGAGAGQDNGAAAARRILAEGPAAGNWPGYGGDHEETHFSPLADVNPATIGKLGLVWSLDLPTAISTMGAPLAVNGTIFITTGSSLLSAVDGKTGRTLWTYDPEVYKVAGEKMRTAWGSRGLAWWNGKVIVGTADGRLLAVNAKTGKLVWSVQTTMGPNDGRTITGAPRVFNGKVIIGHGGADFAPVRGYVTAYDAETGKKLWRFYTVPGKPGTKDGEVSDEIMAKAAATWKGEWWKFGGGGTVWNAITYDPKYNRIYLGTGNGAPWNQNIRSPGGGDNWFLCGIVALDADTGRYLWHYQTNPGETWDFNSAMDIELATLKIGGEERDVILHAPKNAFFYVIDRRTGKLISAEPFGKATWASRIDRETGRPVENPEVRDFSKDVLMWPGGAGAHNWQAMAFSKQTGLAYFPSHELPGFYSLRGIDQASWAFREDTHLTNGFATNAVMQTVPASTRPLGKLIAWDPVAQKERWSVPMHGAFLGGVLATGGNLVFQGNPSGRFVAYAADTGRELWSFDAQNGIVGQPIAWRWGGRQYITVMTGFGGPAGLIGQDAARFGWDYRNQKRRLLTFALGGTAKLPPREPAAPFEPVDDPALTLDMVQVKRGAELFASRCQICHGYGAVAGGAAPDLRASPMILSSEIFTQVLRDGILVERGMPAYPSFSDTDRESLRQYVIFRARQAKHPAG